MQAVLLSIAPSLSVLVIIVVLLIVVLVIILVVLIVIVLVVVLIIIVVHAIHLLIFTSIVYLLLGKLYFKTYNFDKETKTYDFN